MTEKKEKAPKAPTHDLGAIRDVSVEVYKMHLGEDDTKRMLEKDNDGGKKLRGRAAFYDQFTRSYLDVFKIKPGFKL